MRELQHPDLAPPARSPRRSEILNMLSGLEERVWYMMSDPSAPAERRAEIMEHVYNPIMTTLVAARRRPVRSPTNKTMKTFEGIHQTSEPQHGR